MVMIGNASKGSSHLHIFTSAQTRPQHTHEWVRTCVLVGSFSIREMAAATPVMLKEAMGEVGLPSSSSRLERVTKRSSVRVIVISFLWGNFVFDCGDERRGG